MSKNSSFCLLSFLLIFSVVLPVSMLVADDMASLKNLSWEEQKNKTRIILETSEPLVYNVTASQSSSEIQVELQNLDLRNLPQELFINTHEVLSLQTFPQATGQKARITVRMTSFRPHEITAEGNKVYIDVKGEGEDTITASSTSTTVPAQPEQKAEDPRLEEVMKKVEERSAPPALPPTPSSEPQAADAREKPQPQQQQQPSNNAVVAAATIVRDVRVDQDAASADVVLVGDGAFDYDVFELSNPQRIVVDLKSVTIAPSVRKLQSGTHDILSRVRIGQYQVKPNIARAVIDLKQRARYTVIPDGAQLRIHVGVQSADRPAAQAKDDQSSSSSAEPETVAPPVTEPVATATAAPPAAAATTVVVDPEPAAVQQQVAENKPPKRTETKPAAAAAPDNEQFYSFKPDPTLFAQEGMEATPPQSDTGTTAQPQTESPATTGGSEGMGSFQEKTLKSGEKQYTGEPFSFDFKDIDIKDLFRFIADISGLNVILDPTVKGSVTLKLTEVPWDQALDLITKNQGLGYTIEGNVIRIAPLQKIAQEERARVEAERQQMLSAPLVTKVKPLSYAKAMEIDRVVKKLLTAKGSSIVDNRTNTLIITDINTNIDDIINLIDTLDSRTSQVIIEARIVETTKNFSQAFGIQWGFRGIADSAFGNNTTLQFPTNVLADGGILAPTQGGIAGNPLGGYAVNLPTTEAPNSAVLLSMGNILDTFRLDMALMALENTGNGRILSSPKVATQNNTAAEILQGFQVPVQTIANNTFTTIYIAAALRMKVTPQITAEGTVIMDVEVENNRPDFSHSNAQGTPAIVTEKASTTLLVEDGGTTVIGGIFTTTDEYAQGRTPLLYKVPLLGWLFKNTNVTRENRELLIFLTPRILR